MRACIVLPGLYIFCAVLQAALLPTLLPGGWRPDLGLLVTLIMLAYVPSRVGLFLVFAMGLQADVLGSPRLGALTLCYLFGAWAVLAFRRDLVRLGAWGGWIACVLGTVAAHGAYALGCAVLGAAEWGPAIGAVGDRVFAALFWGAVLSMPLGRLCGALGLCAEDAEELRRSRRGKKGWFAAGTRRA